VETMFAWKNKEMVREDTILAKVTCT